MYKLIALDMDGTLLNSQKQISSRTKQAIAKAREQGIYVVLASGRPLAGMRSKLEELDLTSQDDYVLHYNGSIVQNVGTGDIIYQQIIDGRSAKMVARLAQELGVNTHAFSQTHGLITPKTSQYTEVEATINHLPITEMDFEQLSDDHPIIKAMMVAEPPVLTAAIRQLPSSLHQDYTIVQSAAFFLEFLNPKSNKGIGVKAIADHLGIDAKEVICMGDAENDHHMLQYAGLGIAMANAMEETKRIADHITLSNDEDGVAVAIEQFALR
ncbi:sugar-phosphatase [Vibrio sp. V27_P1S3P104]|uniref:sugar-phosphatase n=1 Tax=Vibrio TaxID=662 RepID=UPI000C16FD05|nr:MULTISPECIES: sugar-phosphatase [Vibrio]NAW69340.1 sugar-phosphatase [Vibrio sp. V28_P6S34P95]NAX05163.1 sugar-phosphatase [Vibrio sp. V30_P3S12P165]NAX34082.1 sugar-phosphatase [Vibrio sp. V29_P1S30P107]NAX36551.1 sugar-phosphatase [Vibrio sp. V27_P1S3P104]NAX40519.1 sugar-phosphatase [Vibrio sp. V26_P1S5P106]